MIRTRNSRESEATQRSAEPRGKSLVRPDVAGTRQPQQRLRRVAPDDGMGAETKRMAHT